MKYLILLSILCFCSCGSKERKMKAEKDYVVVDTTFIDKEEYPYLFIEPIPKNRFSFINTYGDPDSCEQNKQRDFSHKWIEIERFKGEYYFYLWFGPAGLNKLIFCDNNFYEVLSPGDHPEVRPILNFIRKNDREFTYVVADRNPEIKDNRIINFYIVDKENQIAIVEDVKWFDKYRLMIAQDKEYNIPILVHQNYQNGIHTFVLESFEDFDKVDYEEILRESGFR